MAQSAGATLSHFRVASGFISFNASAPIAGPDGIGQPEVHHTVGGVQAMYENMVTEIADATPGFTPRANTPVAAVAPSAYGWSVTTVAGEKRDYDQVIMGPQPSVLGPQPSSLGTPPPQPWTPAQPWDPS